MQFRVSHERRTRVKNIERIEETLDEYEGISALQVRRLAEFRPEVATSEGLRTRSGSV